MTGAGMGKRRGRKAGLLALALLAGHGAPAGGGEAGPPADATLARLVSEVAPPYAAGPVRLLHAAAARPAAVAALSVNLDIQGWPVAPAAGAAPEAADTVVYFDAAARPAAEALAETLGRLRARAPARVVAAPGGAAAGALEIRLSAR